MTAQPARPAGRIETCTACSMSFDKRPGESTASLVYRYTAWREAHAHPVEPKTVRVPRRPRQKQGAEGG